MLEMISIRIVVKIPESIYPELISDLSRVQLRDRAERLRVLAMLGLKDLNGAQKQAFSREASDAATTTQISSHTDKEPTRKLIKRLTENL